MVLLKAILLSVLISLWFLVPFLDYMISGDFVIKHVSARTIQERGILAAHLLVTFFQRGGNVYYMNTGMVETEPAGVGISLIAGLLCFCLYVWICPKEERKNKYVKVGIAASAVSVFAMMLSLHVFPWDRIQRMNSFFATLISSIQFPSRFLATATVALTLVAGVVGALIWQNKDRLWKIGYGCMCTLLIGISGLYLINDILFVSAYFKIYNDEGMGSGYIAGGEYLPLDTNTDLIIYEPPKCSEGIIIEQWEKEYLNIIVCCENTGTRGGYLEVPMLWYKGYHAYGENGELVVCQGDNNRVRVEIPSGYAGTVTVRFESPWYWRIAETIAAAAFTVCIVVESTRKRKSDNGRTDR